MLKRFGLILVSLFAASVIIFLITEIIPGDVAQMILGRNVTPDALAALRERLGLMNPPYVRYLHWLGGILQGKLGDSLSMQGVHISDLIIRKGLNSLFLAAASTILLVPLSLLLGVIAGLKEQKWPDSVISTFSLIAISLPEFISGTFLMLVFSVWLRWLPAASSINLDVSLFRQLHLLVLPVVTVSLVLLGYVARMVRASVIEASRSPYARTAILKGLPPLLVNSRHILKNALLPSVTIIAMNIGWLFGGIIIVESVFGYPGLGSLVLFAITQRDVPLIEDVVLLMAAAYLVLNLLADIVYALLNPRIRY
ncbi:MAG TPA: ABC transporter permease [Spirochaetia bacterium]|nr:ABC transporter permease [Spirochaetia bacterium]